jgi:hypothetical protein
VLEESRLVVKVVNSVLKIMYCEFCDSLVLDRNIDKEESVGTYWCDNKGGNIDLEKLHKVEEKTLKGELP